MTANTESRKRAREEDITDCVPLSKRINNLHLNNSCNINNNNNNVSCNNTNNILYPLQNINEHNIDSNSSMLQSYNNNSINASMISQSIVDPTRNNGSLLQCHNTPQNQTNLINTIMESYNQQEYIPCDYPSGEYMPELSPDENPFYYNKNKLLYNLFMERMSRQPDNA